jgi:phytol kinase
MVSGARDILDFFVANFPSTRALILGGPAALAWSTACLMVAGVLKTRGHWRTGDTRKVFHFLIFFSVVVVHWIWGTPGVCLFGCMTAVTIGYALFRGEGHFMFEALAREADAPKRTHYIVIPYLATLIGGLFGNILFPHTAVLGYLVAGFGDAIAEPVGIRLGRHRYHVPAFRGVKTVRSVEGSAAVFVVSALVLIAFLKLSPSFSFSIHAVGGMVLIATVSTFVEAVTPHGWDNATLLAIPAWLGAILL